MRKKKLLGELFFIFFVMPLSYAWADDGVITNKAFLGGDGFSTAATAVAFSPDGNYFVIAQSQRGIYLWHQEHRRHTARFLLKDYIDAVDVDNDGRVLAMTSEGRVMLLTQPTKGRLRSVNLTPILQNETIVEIHQRGTSVRFLDDSHVVLSYGGTVELWNFLGTKLRTYSNVERISDLRFNRKRTKIVTSSYDTNGMGNNKIVVLDKDLKSVNTILTTNGWSMDAHFQPGTSNIGVHNGFSDLIFNGKNLIISSHNMVGFAFHPVEGYWVAKRDRTISLNSLNGLSKNYHWPWSKGSYDALLFSDDGTKLLTWSQVKGARLWYLPVAGFSIPEDDTTLFQIPSPRVKSGAEQLTCKVSQDRAQLTITSTKPLVGDVYWHTTEPDKEICGGGVIRSNNTSNSITVDVHEDERSTLCSAFIVMD